MGGKAAEHASTKCKPAIGAVTGILGKLKADSWEGQIRLYESIVVSTLLYASPIWGLREFGVLETAQLSFFKRLLLLPDCTTSSALRLELGLIKIKFKVFHMTWRWLMKLLKMTEERLPRICFNRKLKLFLDNRKTKYPVSAVYNWVAQVNDLLCEIDCADLWENVSFEFWLSRESDVLERMYTHLVNEDLRHYMGTASCQLKIYREVAVNTEYKLAPASFLTANELFLMTRVIAQLRLASVRICKVSVGRFVYLLDPNAVCESCDLQTLETIEHFLWDCTAYSMWRNRYMDFINYVVAGGPNRLEYILRCDDPQKSKKLFLYVLRALRERDRLAHARPNQEMTG